jgi:hypothetical protein
MTRDSYFRVGNINSRRNEERKTKETTMPSIDQQTSSRGTGSGRARWIAIAVAVAVLAVGVVLLALYGGGGSSGGY